MTREEFEALVEKFGDLEVDLGRHGACRVDVAAAAEARWAALQDILKVFDEMSDEIEDLRVLLQIVNATPT